MVAVLGILVFAGAFAVSVTIIVMAVAPRWRRIARLALGHVEPEFAPLSQLVWAERRIAVRRWASAPVPAAVHRLRAAA